MKFIFSKLMRSTLYFTLLLAACGGGGSVDPSTSNGNGVQSYTIGGTVSGLTGSVVLQNNSGDNLTLTTNGAFTFALPVASGSAYSINVITQPAGQTCNIANGSGVILSANVSNVAITCPSLIGGTLQGFALNLSAVVTTFAGSTSGVSGYTDATGTAARFSSLRGITTDGNNLYVADTYNHSIRKIVIATGVVITLAGSTSGFIGNTDSTGNSARFNTPFGITTDGSNLYVADTNNHSIRKIVLASGVVTTLAGSTTGVAGYTDATGNAARFQNPTGITTDGINLYVADTNNQSIRKIVIATGDVTTLAGSLTSGNTDGTGTAATFAIPSSIITDGSNLYLADTGNHSIRKIVIATGVVTTLAGSTASVSGNSDGTGTAARFNFPYGITTDGINLYVADTNNQSIRKIVIGTGVVTTLAGSTTGIAGNIDATGTAARFNAPWGLTTDGSKLYVGDSSNANVRVVQ
jgi:hypothetical protein